MLLEKSFACFTIKFLKRIYIKFVQVDADKGNELILDCFTTHGQFFYLLSTKANEELGAPGVGRAKEKGFVATVLEVG